MGTWGGGVAVLREMPVMVVTPEEAGQGSSGEAGGRRKKR